MISNAENSLHEYPLIFSSLFEISQDFDDLHRLWFILYKERNLLLSEKQKAARNVRPIIAAEESRYFKVKRSMAAIKHVLSERSKIDKILKEKDPTFVKLPVKGPLFDERTKFEKHRMRQRKSKQVPRVLIDKRGRVSGTHNPLVVTHK